MLTCPRHILGWFVALAITLALMLAFCEVTRW